MLTLEQCSVVAKMIAAELLLQKRMNPGNANIEVAEDAACTVVLSLAAEIHNREMTVGK